MKKQIKKFKIVYIVYIAVLLILAAAAVWYVSSVLKEYEACQPEREVERQIKNLYELARGGAVDSVVSFGGSEESFEISDEEMEKFVNSLAKDTLSYKIIAGSSDGRALTYSVSNSDNTLLYIKLKSLSETTKLSLFTYSEWKTEEVKAALFNYEISLPPSVKVALNGNTLTGSPSSDGSDKLVYRISALGSPTLSISDTLGNVLDFTDSTKINITEYVIKIPDNFTLKADGKEVSPDIARSEENPNYSNFAEYCLDLPKLLTYECAVVQKQPAIEILDPMGNQVEFEMEGNTVTVTEQPSYSDTLPDELSNQIDPMTAAKDWSLFLTKDLSGANNGFSSIAKYFDENSYFYDVAWKYANGIDITFTSPHNYPSFTDEKLSNFIRYTDNCFSCDVFFNKHMLLNSGSNVIDKMNSRFYFVNSGTTDEPKWIIVDIKEII